MGRSCSCFERCSWQGGDFACSENTNQTAPYVRCVFPRVNPLWAATYIGRAYVTPPKSAKNEVLFMNTLRCLIELGWTLHWAMSSKNSNCTLPSTQTLNWDTDRVLRLCPWVSPLTLSCSQWGWQHLAWPWPWMSKWEVIVNELVSTVRVLE